MMRRLIFVEAVVVVVEHAPRLLDVDRAFLRQLPGQLDQPIEIGAHHAVFGGAFRHALQPAQLLAGGVLDFLRHAGFGDGLVELGHLGGLALLAFAQLLLNRGHLLAQQHLALPLVERRLGLLADLGRQPQHLDAVRQQPRHLLHARGDVDRLEHVLLLVRRDVHVGHGHVGQRARLLDRLHGGDQFPRRLRHQLERLQRLAAQVQQAGFDFGRARSPAPGCAARAPPGTASRSGIRRPGSADRPGTPDDGCRPDR